jgi:hypothetical protein
MDFVGPLTLPAFIANQIVFQLLPQLFFAVQRVSANHAAEYRA